MTYTVDLSLPYLGLPVKAGKKRTLLEIFADGKKIQELFVSDFSGESCDYHGWLQLSEWVGKKLILKGNLSDDFFSQVEQAKEAEYAPLTRPLLHFTAERGWLNDPNGLVYQDGVYHLFFQYNPTDTEWGNMSWGHAVSKDLLTFQQVDTVLYPDETGAMYSGSGIVSTQDLPDIPKDSLVFFYTAAGGINPWSAGKAFTQRIAVSTDGGRTLKKLREEAVGVLGQDSRDPQVFWHEDSLAYVMVLWVQGEEIALLRSEDLRSWEMTDRFALPGAFECPNLFCLSLEENRQWVLTVADGSYYFGSFDGFRFRSDGVRRKSYLNELPYAAQVYNGIRNRTVMIPWLRTKNEGRLYTSAMGLPRELSLIMRGGVPMMRMQPVREYERSKKKVCSYEGEKATSSEEASEAERGISFEIKEEAVTELVLTPERDLPLKVEFFGNTLTVEKEAIVFEGDRRERTLLSEPFADVHLLIDRQILEVYGNDYTQTAYYETGTDRLTGIVCVTGCDGMPEVYQWQSSLTRV